jgi:hypothetical protein
MQYKAIVSFSGKLSMAKGQVRKISDQSLIDDLLKAGYIIPLEADKVVSNKAEKPKTKRKGKANED